MKLDRNLQQAILRIASESYPASVPPSEFETFANDVNDVSTLAANLTYLHQHGLISKSVAMSGDVNSTYEFRYTCYPPAATAEGMDFLADDGGLSAILGVVTVKLHEDTIKSIIEAKIQSSDDLDPADKPRYLAALKELPADAIKHLTMKLLDLAVTHGPDALHLIQSALHLK